jgi:outer membrane protein assembly factor BamB
MRWRYRLGGQLAPWQAVLCGGPAPSSTVLLVAPPGRLAAYSLDGDLLWERRNTLTLDLLGCWDLAGDGRTEILAASSGQSGGRLFLFDSQGGSLFWSSPAAPGGVGAVKVVHLNFAMGLRLLWLPAASSKITAFALAPGQTEPETLWSRELIDFVSDPYTYSSLAVGDLRHDGSQQIVISGGRHSIPTIVLDAGSGGELFRKSITIDGHAVESGGTGQLLQLHDVTADGRQEIVTISGYSGAEAYMFQGITVTSFTNPGVDAMLDTFPVGLRYVRGSIQDFDGDGRSEILISRYVPEIRRHSLLLLDASRLGLKALLPNFFLKAIVSANGGRDRVILGSRDVTTETPSDDTPLAALRYDGTTFVETAWDSELGLIAHVRPRASDKTAEDNPGKEAILFNAPATGTEAILLFGDRNHDGKPDELVATDVASGAAIERWGIAPGVPIELLAVQTASDPSRSRFVVGGADGSLILLDGGFRVVRTLPVGGYYRSGAFNGHSFEVAAVADLAGNGRKDVLAVDSLNRVVKLTGLAEATPLQEPRGEVLWDSGMTQELLAVPAAEGGSHLLVRGAEDGQPLLRMIDGSGAEVWSRVFTGGEGVPIGLNTGRFRERSSADIVASIASSSGPRRTSVLDGSSGETIWTSDVGTYWDASFAVGDADRDGLDDIVFNYNVWKGFILKGLSGVELAEPVILPPYRDLGDVDYNGAPIVLGPMGGGRFLFLDSEDDAHLSLLSVAAGPASLAPFPAAVSWSIEQSSADDERYSAAAVAPIGSGSWLVGVGSQKGTLKAVRGNDGFLLWEIGLWSGAAVPVSSTQQNFLSSVLAVDVNGDGQVDFVVGGADGWLYAVDGATGALLWGLDLGASVGDPIAADIDGDGTSEVLVPAADGYLYAIGPRA